MYSLPSPGIEQFSEPTSDVRLDPSVLELFYARRTDLLKPMVENSWCLDKPYGFYDTPSDNLIYKAIFEADLWHFAEEALEAFPLWRTRSVRTHNADWTPRPEDREVFALIDCALYLVHLLNIYEPNRPAVHNIIFTRRQTDALGRSNFGPVVTEIKKLISRSLGVTKVMPARQAEDILLLARLDTEHSQALGRSNKGIDFERQCAASLTEAGITARLTDITGDFGADIIAAIDDLSFAIQCKDTVRPVGVKGIQEVVGARAHYKTDYAVVCATGGFTDAAIALASSNNVALCSVEQLVSRLSAV